MPLVRHLRVQEGRIEKVGTNTHTQDNYHNPRACLLRFKMVTLSYEFILCKVQHFRLFMGFVGLRSIDVGTQQSVGATFCIML